MNEKLEKAFDVRYVKLHFTLEFVEDTVVPVNKASALRGGMGEMLLRANCIRDRKCESCDFEKDCIVRRTMYSPMDIQPTFMTSGESVGYVIECEDYHESFSAGETMSFNLILFGKTIAYFSQFLNAFYALGMSGFGKEQSGFRVVSVTNSKNEPILRGNDVLMANYEVMKVSDYVTYRKRQLQKEPLEGLLKFKSPTAIKYRKEQLTEFRLDAVIESVCRRIYMLDCFEGIESDIHEKEYTDSLKVPEVYAEKHNDVSIRRFSNHKKEAMYLKGMEGEISFNKDELDEELLEILLAGELIHVGKNTSFGFGRYKLR